MRSRRPSAPSKAISIRIEGPQVIK